MQQLETIVFPANRARVLAAVPSVIRGTIILEIRTSIIVPVIHSTIIVHRPNVFLNTTNHLSDRTITKHRSTQKQTTIISNQLPNSSTHNTKQLSVLSKLSIKQSITTNFMAITTGIVPGFISILAPCVLPSVVPGIQLPVSIQL